MRALLPAGLSRLDAALNAYDGDPRGFRRVQRTRARMALAASAAAVEAGRGTPTRRERARAAREAAEWRALVAGLTEHTAAPAGTGGIDNDLRRLRDAR